jgi:Tfp pilus assembly protein PilO
MIHTRTKIIVILSCLFFIGCLFVSIIFLHTVIAHKELYKEKRSIQIENQQSEESMKDILQKLEETKEERSRLFARILYEEDFIHFLTLIETLGKEQHVELETTSLTVKPLNDTFEYVSMHIEFVGSYDSIIHVVTLFEHLPYVTTLDTFTMKKQDGGDVWHAECELRVTKFKKV